jgi:capsule polysaccharide export protein KpsE/RkpR
MGERDIPTNITSSAFVGAQTSSGSTDSVGRMRSQLAQLKRQLDAVKNDDKIDCKTKDAEMQSIERSMTQIQQQMSARAQQQQKAATSAAPNRSAPPSGATDSQAAWTKKSGALVDTYV